MTKLRVTICTALIAAVFFLNACSSSGPATTYYVLDTETREIDSSANNAELASIGVGPVSLPGYLENTAIVSRRSNQVLNVSGFHAWSEPLDQAISRVLAKELASQLGRADVWSFPWDSRNRPKYQVNVVIDQFDGERGQSVFLRAKWFVFSVEKNTTVATGSFSNEVPVDSASYSDYVAGLSLALSQLSEKISHDF